MDWRRGYKIPKILRTSYKYGPKGEDEDCVEMHGGGPYINDIVCYAERRPICQRRGPGSAATSSGTTGAALWPVAVGLLVGVIVALIGLLLYLASRVREMKKSVKVR